MRRHSTHVEAIKTVAQQLNKLGVDVVFTGGSVVGLLLTDTAAPDVRPTDDVDVIVAITKYSDYTSLQDKLRKLGFKHDINGPNCRFVFDGLQIDVMPSEGQILGFANRWYGFAMSSARDFKLPDGTVIRLISAPAFLATKLVAFYDRGKQDFTASHDMEDILAVVDGRSELIDEVKETDAGVREYIAECFADLVQDEEFIDAIAMHLYPDEPSQSRAGLIHDRLIALAALRRK